MRVHFHDRAGVPWQLPAAGVLLALLAALATFQYRWLGEVSQAERERMRASLRTRASEFAQEFDAELARTYVAFQVEGDRLDADPAGSLADAHARWQTSTTTPGLVSAVYLAEGRTFESARLRRFHTERRTLEPAAWPPILTSLMQRTPRLLPHAGGLPPPMMMTGAVEATVPALIVPAPHITRSTIGGQTAVITQPNADARVLIVVLDADRVKRQLLEPLVAKYFGEGDGSEYFVTIVRRDDPSAVVFSSTGAPVDKAGADFATGLFEIRMDELDRLSVGRDLAYGPIAIRDRVAITIVRRANGPDGKRILLAGGGDHGAWEVRARHRSGSLEAIVARSRRRNIAMSLGVLGLLAASVLLALASAQRQRRLARQQMEFVAAVSHELRTPLAVICSAGENLADGVVSEGPQVKRYGSLIETEGRRLGEMVERVMTFAGISSGSTVQARTAVDVSNVIAEATDAVRPDARDRGVTLVVQASGALPPIVGDAGALRSAIQNIVGNAIKYSASGSTVEIGAHVEASAPRIQIRVADRGLGIDAADLPHIFKPFFRGRRAVDAQVRGTGVGLSVVKHVINSHQGTIAVESRPGEGTTIIVALPAQAAENVRVATVDPDALDPAAE